MENDKITTSLFRNSHNIQGEAHVIYAENADDSLFRIEVRKRLKTRFRAVKCLAETEFNLVDSRL